MTDQPDNGKSEIVTEVESVHASYYDIFDKEVEDLSSDWLQYREYFDWNLNSPNAVSDFRVDVKDKDNWFIPSKSYLEIRFNITQQNGTAIAAGENVSLQNNIMGLFLRAELMIDDVIVEYVDNCGICNTVQNLVYFGKDYSDSFAQNQFWFPDTIDNSTFDYVNTSSIPNNSIIFTNTNTNNITTFTLDANFRLTPNPAGAAGNTIQAAISYNGVNYPIRFFDIITTNGNYRNQTTNLTLQNSGAGVFQLAWNGTTASDYIYAYVDTLGVPVSFMSNLTNVIINMATVNGSQFFVCGGGVNGQSFSGVLPWSGIVNSNSVSTLNNVNIGHRNRMQLCANSMMVTCHVPLINVFGLLKSYSAVTSGMKWSLRLTKDIANNMLLCPANNRVVNFVKVSWWMPYVMPNISTKAFLQRRLSTGLEHLVPYCDTQIFRSNLIAPPDAPANNFCVQLKVNRRRPIKLFVAFQIDDPNNANGFPAAIQRVTGGQQYVKRIFDNIQLTSLRAVLNSTDQYPERQYYSTFVTANDYARVYEQLMQCGLKDHDVNAGSHITFQNFQTIFPIFCIDMSEQPTYFLRPNSALIDVYISNNTIVNYYAWFIVEAERKLIVAASDGKMRFINTE